MRIIHLIILLFIGANISLGQLVSGLDLLGDRKKITIPFEYKAGYILVNVRMSKALDLKFIFDTGAEHIVLFEKPIADLLGLQFQKSITILGSDLSQYVSAHISRGVFLKTSTTENVKRDILVLEDNFLDITKITGEKIYGLLGVDYFKNTIIEIDYGKSKITVWHPRHYNHKKGKKEKLNCDFYKHKPYVLSTITTHSNEVRSSRLLLDTGASLSFLLQVSENEKNILPESAIPGSLGKGIGGYVKGYVGSMKSIEINDWKFDNFITNFQEIDPVQDSIIYYERDGLLGNLMLERFKVTIDYIKEEVFLNARGKRIQRPIKYNKSGMVLFSYGAKLEQYIVFEVLPNSPADKIGISKGDIILKVGNKDYSSLSMDNLDRILRKREGKKIRLTLERNDETIEKVLVLENYIL